MVFFNSLTAARSLGLKAQFKRARLFVTSKASTYQWWCSRAPQRARSTFRFHHHLDATLALAGGQWRFTLCRDLGGGTAMRYSLTLPLALEGRLSY